MCTRFNLMMAHMCFMPANNPNVTGMTAIYPWRFGVIWEPADVPTSMLVCQML